MRVAIIGASGLLGKYILREWGTDDEVIGLTSRDFDIRDAGRVREAVGDLRPQQIVLAAAYTDVDGCESNVETAFATNREGAVNVAESARDAGSRLLFLSTDYVFDGSKQFPYEVDDPTNPKTVYGRSKAEAEVRIAEVLPQCCIVRTSWLFGTGGKCFPDTILRLAATRTELDVVNDQRGCPTYARDLARAIVKMCGRQATGIVHATNVGECTWFEFAAEIVRQTDLKTLIRPTTTDKFPRPAQRPKYSVLSGESLRRLGVTMPGWRDALGAYLAERG
jgi:dTDP-4-dehydrorhamnose reductase